MSCSVLSLQARAECAESSLKDTADACDALQAAHDALQAQLSALQAAHDELSGAKGGLDEQLAKAQAELE